MHTTPVTGNMGEYKTLYHMVLTLKNGFKKFLTVPLHTTGDDVVNN